MLHNDSLPIKWICHCCLVRIRMLRRSSVHLIHVSLKGSGIFGFNCWPSSHMIGLSKKSFVMCLVEAWRRMRWAEMSWHWAVGAKGGRGGAPAWWPHSHHHQRSPGGSGDSYRRLHFEGLDQKRVLCKDLLPPRIFTPGLKLAKVHQRNPNIE